MSQIGIVGNITRASGADQLYILWNLIDPQNKESDKVTTQKRLAIKDELLSCPLHRLPYNLQEIEKMC